MKLVSRAILSLMLELAPICAEAHDSSRGDDSVVAVAPDDPDMAAATAQARATLDAFLALSQTPPPGTDTFKLKVMIKDGHVTEHFWVIPFQRNETGFVGILANEPHSVHNVVAGQYVEFNRDDISDWGYTKNGHQVGSFTVCVMFKSMPKEEVDYMRSQRGFDC